MDKERLYFACGIIITAILVGVHLFFSKESSYRYLVDLLSFTMSFFAFIATYMVFRNLGKDRSSTWFFWFSIAMALWTMAEFTTCYYEIVLGTNVPDVSIGDFLFLLSFMPLTYSIYLVFESLTFMRVAYWSGVITYVILSAALFLFAKESLLNSSQSAGANIVNIWYVMGDILFLSLSVPLVLAFLSQRVGIAFLIIGLAIAIGALGDAIYFQFSASGESLLNQTPSLFNIIEYLWFGIASLLFLEQRSENPLAHMSRP